MKYIITLSVITTRCLRLFSLYDDNEDDNEMSQLLWPLKKNIQYENTKIFYLINNLAKFVKKKKTFVFAHHFLLYCIVFAQFDFNYWQQVSLCTYFICLSFHLLSFLLCPYTSSEAHCGRSAGLRIYLKRLPTESVCLGHGGKRWNHFDLTHNWHSTSLLFTLKMSYVFSRLTDQLFGLYNVRKSLKCRSLFNKD